MGSSGQDLVESAVKKVTGSFGSAVTVEAAGDLTAVITEKSKVRDLLLFLKGEKDLAFTLLTDLFAVDCHGRDPRFEIVYLLTSVEKNGRLVVKTRIGDGESVATVSDIFATANWLEREAYDMFGLRFDGHPNLSRILTVDDFEGHPLRKDFPTEGYGFDKPFVVNLGEETN